MRKTGLLFITFSFPLMLFAQQPLNAGQLEVQQTIQKMFDALSDRDSISLKNHSTADVTFYEYGQVWNMDTLILKAIALNRSADFKRTNHFDFINTVVDKTTAWATYRLESVMTRDGKQATVQWLETVVLVKKGSQWKVNHLHSTLLKRN